VAIISGPVVANSATGRPLAQGPKGDPGPMGPAGPPGSGGGGGGAVDSVTASAPLTSSGGANPNLALPAATDSSDGFMLAADKAKLDGLTAVTGTAPIAVSGGVVSITPASDGAAGSMSASDKTKLDGLSAGGWTTALDLDFTALATQSLATDGAYTLSGVVFQKINSVNDASPAVITHGVGLVLQPNATANNYLTTRTGPGLTVNLASIIPNLGPDTPVRLSVYNSANNSGGNYDGATIALENPTLSTNYSLKRGYSSGFSYDAILTTVGGNQDQNTGGSLFSDNVMVVSLFDGIASGRGQYFAGVYGSGWPAPATCDPLGIAQMGAAGVTDTHATFGQMNAWDALLTADRSGSTTALVITYARLRVEYKS
jgi:hypothetical protein